MVVIRLARVGKKKQAFYRIVVADSKRAVTSKFIQIVGWYNPHTKELNIKEDQVKDWLSKGAVPSNSLAVILKNSGMKLPDWVKIKEKVRKPKKEVEVKPEAKPQKTEEAPAEESVSEEVATETTEEANTNESEEVAEAPAEEEVSSEEAEAPTE